MSKPWIDTKPWRDKFNLSEDDALTVMEASESCWDCTIDDVTQEDADELIKEIRGMR